MPAINTNSDIVEFTGANATDLSNFQAKVTGQTRINGRINNFEILVFLKYLRSFWGTFEMPLINCEISLILTWSENFVIIYTDIANKNPTLLIDKTTHYVHVITLSTQDNAKLFQQLKSGFKRTINCNKYLSKPELLAQNSNLNHLVKASFQGVNRLFVL